jgi:hypothetical protein
MHDATTTVANHIYDDTRLIKTLSLSLSLFLVAFVGYVGNKLTGWLGHRNATIIFQKK